MKRVVVGAAVLALGVSGVGYAQADGEPVEKVTGGGQVIADSQAQGPGDTVGFVAQLLEDDSARGQFQYHDRTGDDAGTKIHGVVDCLVVDGNTATFAGDVTRGGDGEERFRVDIVDNGEQGNDIVQVTYPDEGDCDDEYEVDDEQKLGRGNVKIHGQESEQE